MLKDSQTTKSAVDVIDQAIRDHGKLFPNMNDPTSVSLTIYHALRNASLVKRSA